MAGIITNVGEDIKSLQQLRQEIENVKKALGSIDINVKIDIRKELEQRLQSLTKQYDSLVAKAAEADAKIMESAARMDKAVDSITKAHEKAEKAAMKQTSSAGTKTQTEAVEVQAKAYLDLKDEIDAILGTREQNIRQMMQEQNAIKLINAEIVQINKSRQSSGRISQTQAQRLQTLNDDLLMHRQALAEVRQELANNAKLDLAAVGSMNELSQSLSRMRIAYRALNEDERNSEFGQNLLKSIQEADAKIKELDATIGNHQRNVGNYQGSFNGLNMSVQQIVRELPAAKMGINMFFMAISNNLPIMADQIKLAKEANKAMKEAGQEPVPVWRQLVSSLFSWQSAMMVGITLLTVYGKDIANWVKELFKAKTAISDLVFAQQQLRTALKEARKDAISEQVKLKTLYAATQDATIAMKDRLTAVKQMKEQYPSYFSKLSNEAILAGQAAGAYRQLAADILKAAQARAMEKRIEKLAYQNYDLERSNNADKNWKSRNRKAYQASVASHSATDNGGARAFVPTGVDMSGGKRNGDLEIEWSEREERLKKHTEQLNRNNKTIQILTDKVAKIKATELSLENQPKPKKEKKEKAGKEVDYDKMQREQSEAERNLENAVAQSRIDAMQEGYEKEKKQRELNHKKELEDIDKKRSDFLRRKIDDAKRIFDADPKNKGKKFDSSSVTLTGGENAKFDEMRANVKIKHANEYTSNEDKLIREHQSYTDKRLEIERKYSIDIHSINQAIKEAEMRGDKERVAALKRSLLEAQTEFGKSKMTLAFEELKKSPQYSVAYDDLGNASSETIENLLKRFEEVKEAAGFALDPESARAYFGAINGMIDELIERDPVGMLSKLSAQLKEQELSLARSRDILERVRKGENIIKGVNYDKETKKWVISYYDLASAEEEVAVKGKEVAETTNKIVKAEKKLSEKVKELAVEISNLGNAMGGQTGEIVSMFGSILSFYQTTVDGITAVARTGANALSTIEKASVILSIISAAIQLMSTLSKMLPSTDDFYQKAAKKQAEINKLRKSVEDYRLSVLKAQQSENNWFSSTGLQSLKDAYVENGKVAEAYYSELYEAQEKYIDKSSGLKKAIVPIAAGLTAIAAVAAGVFTAGTGTAAIGALGASLIGALSTTAATATVATAVGAAAAGLAGAIAGTAIQSAVNSITYKNGQTAAVDNLRIQTRHKSFWRGQKTADLRDWVKEKYGKSLFDKDGMIDADLANAVLKDYGDKLQGETKQTLEELVKLREKYDEFKKQIQDYVSEMYSPLVSDMADAVWEWLKNGKSALAQFKEKASETFADIAKEMIKQAILSKIFGSYKDDLQKLYETYATGGMSEKDLANNVGVLTDRLLDRAEKGLPQMEELATYINEQFEKRGFNVTGKATSQKATINEARNLSEDTGSQIVGRLTSVQIAAESGNVKRDAANVQLSLMNAKIDDFKMTQIQTRDIADETRTILADSYLELKEINANTGNSAAHLKEIRSDIKDLKKIMDDKL